MHLQASQGDSSPPICPDRFARRNALNKLILTRARLEIVSPDNLIRRMCSDIKMQMLSSLCSTKELFIPPVQRVVWSEKALCNVFPTASSPGWPAGKLA